LKTVTDMGDELHNIYPQDLWDSRTAPTLDGEFEALVIKFGPFMSYVARTVFSSYGVSHESVADVVQEALLAVFQARKKGTIVENTLAYLRTVTARHAINAAKSLKRRNECSINDEESGPPKEIRSRRLDPSQIYEMRVMFNAIFSNLNDKEKVILEMSRDGFSGEEIGAVMSMTRVNINVTLHRVRQKFKPLAEYLNW